MPRVELGIQMDFGALPPKVNSGQNVLWPRLGPMLAAAAAWSKLAGELYSAAASYSSVISGLTGESWWDPASASMATAAEGYLAWMKATASQAEQAATQASAAASAFEAAFAATVPPPVIAANRALLRCWLQRISWEQTLQRSWQLKRSMPRCGPRTRQPCTGMPGPRPVPPR